MERFLPSPEHLQFDPKEGKQVLRPFTDLDGKSAVGIFGLAGIDTSNLKYVKSRIFGGSDKFRYW